MNYNQDRQRNKMIENIMKKEVQLGIMPISRYKELELKNMPTEQLERLSRVFNTWWIEQSNRQ